MDTTIIHPMVLLGFPDERIEPPTHERYELYMCRPKAGYGAYVWYSTMEGRFVLHIERAEDLTAGAYGANIKRWHPDNLLVAASLIHAFIKGEL